MKNLHRYLLLLVLICSLLLPMRYAVPTVQAVSDWPTQAQTTRMQFAGDDDDDDDDGEEGEEDDEDESGTLGRNLIIITTIITAVVLLPRFVAKRKK